MPKKAPTHRPPRAALPDGRPSAARRGYDATWARFSRAFRARHPVCQACGTKSSEHVDHITALEAGGDKWDESNLRALCASCHSKKTYREDGSLRGKRRGYR